MNPSGERTLIHKGKKFDFELLTFPGAGGAPISREVVRHPGAVCILPIIEGPEGLNVVLIRNRRFALGRELWELPAGTLEPPEAPASCAARELIEETGFQASEIIPLGTFYTTPGMTDELMHAFAARGLSQVGQRLEVDEQIVTHTLPLHEVFAMLDRGELMDAKSIVTLTLGQRQGMLKERGANR